MLKKPLNDLLYTKITVSITKKQKDPFHWHAYQTAYCAKIAPILYFRCYHLTKVIVVSFPEKFLLITYCSQFKPLATKEANFETPRTNRVCLSNWSCKRHSKKTVFDWNYLALNRLLAKLCSSSFSMTARSPPSDWQAVRAASHVLLPLPN